ncbi:DUF1254 domain-containing protein [Nocardia yamanashiensis]|uniref:DUF1254 domain-containing protein n=1 Tax=Nocardia yamanashiensis TaxID=209247 RepID=UPI000A02A754
MTYAVTDTNAARAGSPRRGDGNRPRPRQSQRGPRSRPGAAESGHALLQAWLDLRDGPVVLQVPAMGSRYWLMETTGAGNPPALQRFATLGLTPGGDSARIPPMC